MSTLTTSFQGKDSKARRRINGERFGATCQLCVRPWATVLLCLLCSGLVMQGVSQEVPDPAAVVAVVEARLSNSSASEAGPAPNSDDKTLFSSAVVVSSTASAVKEAIGSKLQRQEFASAVDNDEGIVLSSVASGTSIKDSIEESTVSSFSKGEVESSADGSNKQPQVIELESVNTIESLHIHHHSALDVVTMVVALVMAVLILPLAFAYRVSASFRNAVLAISSKPHMMKKDKDKGSDDYDKVADGPFQPRLLSLLPMSSTFRSILSPQDVDKLVPHLPYHLSAKDWQLLYASELHGYSLHSAYRRAAAMGPCLLAAMDMNRTVFAAFCSESLKPNGTNYFGNGECWVASVSPHFQVHKWQPGNNEQFVLASDSFLGFGGGGTFALWFDAQFERGTSEPNKTYGNDIVLASAESFKLASVEVWGFASPSLRTSLGTKAFKTVTSVMGRIASKASTSFSSSATKQ